MRNIVIYSGRFQPFGKHHYQSYLHLCQKFGKNNVFVCTSDNVDEQSPLSFNDKQKIANMFGVTLYKVKSPYKPVELTSMFHPNNTTLTFAVGRKDSTRLNTNKYLQPYKNTNSMKSLSNNGYVYIIPHQSILYNNIELSGTNLRRLLSTADKNEFMDIMGWYNPNIDSLFKQKFKNTITEGNRITKTQLQRIEQYVDKFFKQFNIDVDFQDLYKGTHFYDRLNDPRNGNPIETEELRKIFKLASYKYGSKISAMNIGANAVLKDMETDINIPFVLKWDKDNEEIDLVPKTIMRKKDFYSSSPILPVTESEYKNVTKTKHISHIYEDEKLTYNEVYNIFESLLNNSLELYEKVDGQNLQMTIRNGQPMVSRNKTTTKAPLTIEQFNLMYEGRGDLQYTFYNAAVDFGNALNSLNEDIKNEIEENNLFINFEILHPKTKNVFEYGEPKIMIHNITKFDENGNELCRYKKSGEKMFEVLSGINATMQKTFNIIGPNIVKINNNAISLKEIYAELYLYSRGQMNSVINKPKIMEFIDKLSYNILNLVEGNLFKTDMGFVDSALNSINESLDNEVDITKFNSNKKRYYNIVEKNKPNDFEGFVFEFNNYLYKLTGSFGPLNQCLGVKRYKR